MPPLWAFAALVAGGSSLWAPREADSADLSSSAPASASAVSAKLPAGYLRILALASRPHFFAFPMGAAMAGAATSTSQIGPLRLSLLLIASGVGWGVGQLLNDVLDKEADEHDAPDRPAVQGLLPAKPTIIIAVLIGLVLAAIVAWLHPSGWLMGLCAMVLIVTYNQFKRFPLMGNLSHGIVMSVACLIGAGAASPDLPLQDLLWQARWAMLMTGLWAGLYLASNYEKDRRGDALAGYNTIAHVVGIRASAVARGIAALTFCAAVFFFQESWLSRLGLIVGAVFVLFSALRAGKGDNEEAALQGYRAAIHGGAIGMLALGAAAAPVWLFALLAASSLALTESAFRRSPNP